MEIARSVPPRTSGGRRNPIAAWWAARTPLFRDVAVVLIVKALLLWLLWFAFFRAPAAPKMTMEPQRVEQRLLAPVSAPDTARPGG